MRVLVTGATGFIGAGVVRMLSEEHHQVSVLALRGTEHAVTHVGVAKIVLGGLDDSTALDKATRGVDVVIHLAALLPNHPPAALSRTNVVGTRNLMHSCTRNQVRRIVFASSTSVYAQSSWPLAHGITEHSPVRMRAGNRIEFYGLTKAQAEQAIVDAHQRSTLEYVILRSPVVYGSTDGWDRKVLEGARLLPAPALSAPLRNLQWLHADDLNRAIKVSAFDARAANEVFNIAGIEVFSLGDIALTFRAIERSIPVKHPLLPARPQLRYSVDKARARLGFIPRIDLREGCRRQLALR
jgi:nucleoside-diphosphate-sugar epimerase